MISYPISKWGDKIRDLRVSVSLLDAKAVPAIVSKFNARFMKKVTPQIPKRYLRLTNDLV